MNQAMGIPSRLGSHRIHLTRAKFSFGTTVADEDATNSVVGTKGGLTIGQLNRRGGGVDARKDTPIPHIGMGDQRDWFSAQKNVEEELCQSLCGARRGVWSFRGEFSQRKRDGFGGNTDPMKV